MRRRSSSCATRILAAGQTFLLDAVPHEKCDGDDDDELRRGCGKLVALVEHEQIRKRQGRAPHRGGDRAVETEVQGGVADRNQEQRSGTKYKDVLCGRSPLP